MRRHLPVPALISATLIPAVLLIASTPRAHADYVIGQGPCSAGVNEYGVIVSTPPEGLVTVDGPRAALRGDFAEWWGIAFVGPTGPMSGVGPGTEADWGERTPVDVVSSESSNSAVWSVTRLGDLEIRTEFSYDAHLDLILVLVTFTNLGHGTIADVVYTREWREEVPGGWSFPTDLASAMPPSPSTVSRRLWMPDVVLPGVSRGLRFSYTPTGPAPRVTGETPIPGRAPGAGIDVPLSLWTGPGFPSGVQIGLTNGISWGDYDRDGWIDMFAARSGNLWRNLGGTTWMLAADLDAPMGGERLRYGSSFGDYNNDGRPDIATEPRRGTGEGMHLLKNLGGAVFQNVAGDPAIIDVRPQGDSETICWGDVNGDSLLDCFIPVYPPWVSSNGNYFLFNRGPTGPGGEYRFNELSAPAGLDNPPPASARPEGAQMVDVDFDGDLDIYSNGTLYQNRSTFSTADYDAMTETASGIGLSTALDEGAALFDYDLDGDYDLAIVYTSQGVRIWEGYGDGMFFQAELSTVDNPFSGLDLGLSAEDWDNDGDIDFTTRQIFRRNQFVEEGTRHFTVATHTIPSGHITSATPAWGDWDKDGDLDCALGNWLSDGHFYHNTLYNAATPVSARRYVRVRVMHDSDTVPGELESEFGAAVEISVIDDASGYRRKKFTSSAHGYLNQNEYVLHFALPDDPAPGDPTEDVHFDVTVDMPGLPSDGLYRVDKYVNPALGDLNLAALTDREIVVFRSGRVRVNGTESPPAPAVSPLLITTTGGMGFATATTPLSAPSAPPATQWFVGMDFNTGDADAPLRMKEIILDGQLDTPVACGADTFNIALWDVTDTGAPFRVPGGSLRETTSSRNRRTHIPADIVLEADRHYRLVAGVTLRRAKGISAPVDEGPLTVVGGLSFRDLDPCSGAGVLAAAPITSAAFIAFRFSPDLGAATEVASSPGGAAIRTELFECRPNPFNPETSIRFRLASRAETTLDIFDVAGRRVRRLVGDVLSAGEHQVRWDGKTDDGRAAASGIYVYRMRVNGTEVGSHKALLVK